MNTTSLIVEFVIGGLLIFPSIILLTFCFFHNYDLYSSFYWFYLNTKDLGSSTIIVTFILTVSYLCGALASRIFGSYASQQFITKNISKLISNNGKRFSRSIEELTTLRSIKKYAIYQFGKDKVIQDLEQTYSLLRLFSVAVIAPIIFFISYGIWFVFKKVNSQNVQNSTSNINTSLELVLLLSFLILFISASIAFISERLHLQWQIRYVYWAVCKKDIEELRNVLPPIKFTQQEQDSYINQREETPKE